MNSINAKYNLILLLLKIIPLIRAYGQGKTYSLSSKSIFIYNDSLAYDLNIK